MHGSWEEEEEAVWTLKMYFIAMIFFFIREKSGIPSLKSGKWILATDHSYSAHSAARRRYFSSHANLPVIVEATEQHSNSSVHINVPLQQEFLSCQQLLPERGSPQRPSHAHYTTKINWYRTYYRRAKAGILTVIFTDDGILTLAVEKGWAV